MRYAIILYLFCLSVNLFAQDTIQRSNTTIYPLFYRSTSPPTGSSSKELLRYEKFNGTGLDLEDRLLEISIGGNIPDGIGKDMRVSMWNAASVAGQIMGDPLFDKIFSLRMKGRVDGPSAGGLFTVAMLSLMNGDKLIPNVTMTGTILPDGSIGAVGGVRYKLDGAKEAGMKKIVLPDTLRIETDQDGNIVELETYGKKLGLEVVFSNDVNSAYKHFTGKTLNAYLSKSKLREIELPEPLNNKLKLRTANRYKFVAGLSKVVIENGLPDILKFEDNIKFAAVSEIVKNEFSLILKYLKTAETLMQEEDWIGAFESVNNAYVSIVGLLTWQRGDFAFFNDDQINELMSIGIKNLFESRDLMVGAISEEEIEKIILRIRSFHDGLNIFAIHKAHDYSNNTLIALATELEERWNSGFRTSEIKNAYEKSVAASRVLDASRSLVAAKVIGLKEATGGLNKEIQNEDELDLDLLSGAFTLRGDNADNLKLDIKKVKKWLMFNKTRNDILLESLKNKLSNEELALNDIYVRKATALIESSEFLNNEKEKIFEGINDQSLKLFAEAVLYAKQEVEFRIAIMKAELQQNQGSAFKKLLLSVKEKSNHAIQESKSLGYKLYGPRYDYLRANSLSQGDSDSQLMALRLYMSSCSLARLIKACTLD